MCVCFGWWDSRKSEPSIGDPIDGRWLFSLPKTPPLHPSIFPSRLRDGPLIHNLIYYYDLFFSSILKQFLFQLKKFCVYRHTHTKKRWNTKFRIETAWILAKRSFRELCGANGTWVGGASSVSDPWWRNEASGNRDSRTYTNETNSTPKERERRRNGAFDRGTPAQHHFLFRPCRREMAFSKYITGLFLLLRLWRHYITFFFKKGLFCLLQGGNFKFWKTNDLANFLKKKPCAVLRAIPSCSVWESGRRESWRWRPW